MRRNFWALAIFAIGFQVLDPVAPGFAQDGELARTIEARHDSWNAAFSAGDAAGLADFFTPDAIWRGAGGAVIRGRDSIGRLLAAVAGRDFSSQVDSVEALGADLALDSGTYSAEWGNVAGQQSLEGRYVVLFRQSDGAWKIDRVFDFPEMPPAAR